MSLSGSKKKRQPAHFLYEETFLEAPQHGVRLGVTGCKDEKQRRGLLRRRANAFVRVIAGLAVPGGRWKWQPAAAARPVCKQLSHKQGRPGSARMSAPLSTSRHINERRPIHNEGTEKVIKIDGGTCQGKNDDAILSLRFVCGRAGKMFTTHNPHVMFLKSLKENNVNSCEIKCLSINWSQMFNFI